MSRIEPSCLLRECRDFIFGVHTTSGGFNAGRTYFFRAAAETERDAWIKHIRATLASDRVRLLYDSFDRIGRFQART